MIVMLTKILILDMDKKILNIDKLRNSNKPVTMGLRIIPQTKIMLVEEASKQGITLSEYVLRIITDKIEVSQIKIKSLNDNLNDKEKLIRQYESPHLKNLFEKEKGKTHSFVDKLTKNKVTIVVEQLTDMYKLLLNSFENA